MRFDKQHTSPQPVPFPGSYWVLPAKLLAGNYPGDFNPRIAAQKLNALFDHGIGAVFSLMQEDESVYYGAGFLPYQQRLREMAWTQGKTIHWRRFPIPDFGVPSQEEMTGILDAIDLEIQTGRAVYIHCWAGIGRTGTVVGCYLARHGLALGPAVLNKIKELRAGIRPFYRSPENEEQARLVQTWKKGV